MTSSVAIAAEPAEPFDFLVDHPEYGSPRKRGNYERLVEARDFARLTVGAAPAWIRFEASAHCNLRCCWAQRTPHHPGLRPRGHASPELARRIVQEVGDRLYEAILCHWGEPLLNPRLPEIVSIFHRAGIHTTLDTNMTLMTPELAERLVHAGLDRISVSIDGVSPGVYAQYRKGGSVEQAIAGLGHMLEARRRLHCSSPVVRWQYLVFPHNEHEVDQAEDLACRLGVDVFDAFGGSGRRWIRKKGFLPASQPVRPPGLLCDEPWTYLAVDWDGAVHICCRAFQARHVVGHLKEACLLDIFDGPGFQLARRVIRDGRWPEEDGPTPCTACNRVKLHVPAIASLNHLLSLD